LLLVVSTSDDLDDYVFVQDTNRLVEVCFGTTIRQGYLDKDGKFSARGRTFQKGQVQSSISPAEVGVSLNLFPEKNVYEYRSERLIKGEINEDGKFTTGFIRLKPRSIFQLEAHVVTYHLAKEAASDCPTDAPDQEIGAPPAALTPLTPSLDCAHVVTERVN